MTDGTHRIPCKAFSSERIHHYLRCEYRGKRVGEINCGCAGKPGIYECKSSETEFDTCILRKAVKWDGQDPNVNNNICFTCPVLGILEEGKK